MIVIPLYNIQPNKQILAYVLYFGCSILCFSSHIYTSLEMKDLIPSKEVLLSSHVVSPSV